MERPLYGILGTGATQNYIKIDMPCANKVKTMQVTQVLLPDESLMQATHGVELKSTSLLSTRSKTSYISPHLQSGAIISIGQLCDDIYTATFNATHTTVY